MNEPCSHAAPSEIKLKLKTIRDLLHVTVMVWCHVKTKKKQRKAVSMRLRLC